MKMEVREPLPTIVIIKMPSDMRHIVHSMIAFSAICLSMTACQNEIIPDATKDVVMTMTVQATQANTRTAIGIDGQSTTWKKDDVIGICELSGGEAAFVDSDPLENDADAISSFNVQYYYEPIGTSFQYVGVYPNNYVRAIKSDTDSDVWSDAWGSVPSQPRWGFVSTWADWQRPKDGSFDPEADLMFSRMTAETTNRPSTISLSFARVGTIVKITLTGLNPGDIVDSGCLQAGESWLASGVVYYDPTAERVSYLSAPIKGMNDFSSVISFQPDGVLVDEDGKAVIWLRTLSGTLTDNFTIKVTTFDASGKNQRDYLKVVDLASKGKSIVFDEGGITAFTVAMEPAPAFYFTQETLEYFPELAGESPKLRLPRDYFKDLPIEINSNYEWEISIEYDEEDEDWFDFWHPDWNRFYIRSVYMGYPPTYLRTARMVLTCQELEESDENYQPVVIPIEEYQIVTVVKNGEILWSGDWQGLSIGESIELTAYVQRPSWMNLDENPINWVYYPENYSTNVSSNGLSCTITGIGEGDDRVSVHLVGEDLLWNEPLDYEAQWLGFAVEPFELRLDYEGTNVTEKTVTVGRGEEFTLSADLSGISLDAIEDAYWIVASDYDWSGDEPVYVGSGFLSYEQNNSYPNYSVTVTAGDEYGYDGVALYVKLNDKNETEEYLSCEVFVSPVRIRKGNENLTGKNFKVVPGQETILTAAIDDDFASMLEMEGLEMEQISWGVGYGDYDKNDEYVQGTGNPISLTFNPESPYSATVTAKKNPLWPSDEVMLIIKLNGTDDLNWMYFDCRFVIATPYPIPTSYNAKRWAPNNRHVNRPLYQFKRYSNRPRTH